ncbi:MAG: YraN family protein [Candidatus Latescibacterota bacterium]|nr:YraN family protein [Candidatus Latescibacterota bacterium]
MKSSDSANLSSFGLKVRGKNPRLSTLEPKEIHRRIDRGVIQLEKPCIAREETRENWLLQSRFTTLERNWQPGMSKIDLIAQCGDTIGIIEAKSTFRKAESIEKPASGQKQVRIGDAAKHYLQKTWHHWPPIPRDHCETIWWHFQDQSPAIGFHNYSRF